MMIVNKVIQNKNIKTISNLNINFLKALRRCVDNSFCSELITADDIFKKK